MGSSSTPRSARAANPERVQPPGGEHRTALAAATDSVRGRPMAPAARRLFPSLCLFRVAEGFHSVIYVTFAGYFFREQFALSLADASVLLSLVFILYGALQFLAALFVDVGVRLVGYKLTLLRAPAISAIGWLVMALAPTPPLAVLGGAVIGLGGASLPLLLALVADHVRQRRSGLASGFIETVFLGGQVLGLALGWALVSAGQVTVLFPLVGVAWALVALVLALALPYDRAPAPSEVTLARVARGRLAQSGRAMWRMLAEPSTRAIKLLLMIAAVAPTLASTYIPLYLIALVPEPATGAAYIAVATGAGYVLGLLLTPALGYAADRWRSPAHLVLGVLALAAGALLLICLTENPLVVSGLAVVVGLCGRWLRTLQNALLLELGSGEQEATFYMANQLPYFAGLPIGLLLSMGVIGATGSIVGALVLVSAIFGAGGAIWARHLRRSCVPRPAMA